MILKTKLRKNMLNPQPQSPQQYLGRQSFKTKYGIFGSFPGKQFVGKSKHPKGHLGPPVSDKNVFVCHVFVYSLPPSKLLCWDLAVPAIVWLWPNFNKNKQSF